MGVCSGRLKKGVLGAGTARKRGVLGAGPTRKRGVLGAGQVKKGGSLPRHIPILNIYVSTPPGGHRYYVSQLTRFAGLSQRAHAYEINGCVDKMRKRRHTPHGQWLG